MGRVTWYLREESRGCLLAGLLDDALAFRRGDAKIPVEADLDSVRLFLELL